MDLQVAKSNFGCRINISKIIPTAYKRQLTLVPYTIAISQPKKAGKILQILKQTQQELDTTKNKQQISQNTKQKLQNTKPTNPNLPTQFLKQQSQKIIYHHNKIENNQINQQNPLVQINALKQKVSKNFLKRIRNVQGNIQIIICRNDQEDKDRIIEKLQKLQLIDKVYIKQLPAEAPLTKLQFEQWSKLWPINFIQQQISKQVIHSPAQISFLNILHTNKILYPNSFYLIDSKLSQILLQQTGYCSQQTIFHPIMRLLKEWPLSSSYNKKPQKYYYLTDLKMYVRGELCGMCTMALVHSRLKAIYMTYTPTQVMDQIMGNKRLNHQIMMFTIK